MEAIEPSIGLVDATSAESTHRQCNVRMKETQEMNERNLRISEFSLN